ncbi:MAG TPA: SCO family protein [Acidobacteriota bacterium]|nr:SCO family protein [Acidobacteriota bacterium]
MQTTIQPAEGGRKTNMKEKQIWFLLIVFIAGIISVGSYYVFFKREMRGSGLPIYDAVPYFKLTERSGKTVSLSDLKGQVWVADFIFTNCAESCPVMSLRMKGLQEASASEGIRLVSFSVDPNRDTPEVLASYANKYGADKNRWLFLTGKEDFIHALAIKGFHLGVDKEGKQTPILHSDKFVLVDRKGRIRGYFESSSEEGKKDLLRAIRSLQKEAV